MPSFSKVAPWVGALTLATVVAASWSTLQGPAQEHSSAAKLQPKTAAARAGLPADSNGNGATCDHGIGEGCDAQLDDSEGVLKLPAGKAVILEFSSAFCAACKAAEGAVSDALQKCGADRKTVEIVDVDNPDGAALAKHYEVQALPTFLALDASGRIQSRLIGRQGTDSLVTAIDAVAPCEATNALPSHPTAPKPKEG